MFQYHFIKGPLLSPRRYYLLSARMHGFGDGSRDVHPLKRGKVKGIMRRFDVNISLKGKIVK